MSLSQEEQSESGDRAERLPWWALPLVLATVLAVYWPLRTHSFVDYDTDVYLTGNAQVRAGLTAESLRWAWGGFQAANYHPLTWMSHMLDVELFGLDPAGHLLHNAVLHALNAGLVLLLFRLMGMSRAVALIAALLFALHPLRVEPVAWIAERKDLLASLFGLSSLCLWIQGRGHGGKQASLCLTLSTLCLAASLLCKPMFVTLPCLFVILEIWPLIRLGERTKTVWGALALAFGLSAGSAALTVLAQADYGAMQGLGAHPLSERIAVALEAYRWYLAAQIWPVGLAFHYPLPEWNAMGVALRAVVLALLVWFLLRMRNDAPWITVGGLWFLGTLVPVIGIVQVGAQAWADRFSYLPSIGLLLGLGLSIDRWVTRRGVLKERRAQVAALGVALVMLGLSVHATRMQLATWRDTESLARHALGVTQRNVPALVQLGIALAEQGELDGAVAELEAARTLEPANPDVCINLGALRLRKGEIALALPLLEQGVDLVPMRAYAWSHLGAAHLMAGGHAAALECLEQALELDPLLAGAHTNRAALLEAQNQLEPARDGYQRALRLKPESESAQTGLVRVWLRIGARAHSLGDSAGARAALLQAQQAAALRPRLQQEVDARRREWFP
jgi:Tfp pilus assembly protein PilF